MKLVKKLAIALAACIGLAIVVGAVVYFAFPEVLVASTLRKHRAEAGVELRTAEVDEHSIVYLDRGSSKRCTAR
jgi:hypothetical protein